MSAEDAPALRWRAAAVLLACLCAAPQTAYAAAKDAAPQPVTRMLEMPDRAEMQLQSFEAGRDTPLVIWFHGRRGVTPELTQAAGGLTRAGLSAWLPDWFSVRFLPVSQASLSQVPDADLTTVLTQALAATQGDVFLLASGGGAHLALQAARAWRVRQPDDRRVRGLILFHPTLFAGRPEPGQRAPLSAHLDAPLLPVFLLQPEQSAGRWLLPEMAARLEGAGNPVFRRLLPGVRDAYFLRQDLTAAEIRAAHELPGVVRQATAALRWYAAPALTTGHAAAASTGPSAAEEEATNAGGGLLGATAKPLPAPPLSLPDMTAKPHALTALHGQVVLVNFWATWCPPCVKELPSMQRLHRRFQARGFTTLAVDVAEPRAEVSAFLKRIPPLDFPVLLDEDGAARRAWQVHAFPSSFVLDRAGRIRHAFYGAIEWDDPSVIRQIEALLTEAR
jgi:peroxiredoxin